MMAHTCASGPETDCKAVRRNGLCWPGESTMALCAIWYCARAIRNMRRQAGSLRWQRMLPRRPSWYRRSALLQLPGAVVPGRSWRCVAAGIHQDVKRRTKAVV